MSYTESDYTKKWKDKMTGLEGTRPGSYQSQHTQQTQDAMDKLLNREKFQYDVNEDALYQQMKNDYIRQGRMAMQDTMGQAATMTGGYGNSYAQNAGQQAYQGYLKQISDNLPEYYQMAQNAYDAEGDRMKEQYALLTDQENQDYNRFMDSWNRWQQEYQNAQSGYESGRNFDYGVSQDQAALAQAQVNYLIGKGIMPNEDLLGAAGYDQQYIDDIIRRAKAAAAPASYGGGGGSPAASEGETDPTDVYMELKKNGASSRELDSYLKQCISEGRIDQQSASDLRNKRF